MEDQSKSNQMNKLEFSPEEARQVIKMIEDVEREEADEQDRQRAAQAKQRDRV